MSGMEQEIGHLREDPKIALDYSSGVETDQTGYNPEGLEKGGTTQRPHQRPSISPF